MLQDHIDLKDFFEAVSRCEGEVLFLSPGGDRMDLRSALCQYLISSVYLNQGLHLDGKVLCERPEDTKRLKRFLTA